MLTTNWKDRRMATAPADREKASFAEEALRLGGKSEEEVRRMGAVDKADEQVDAMFARNHQTTASPVHRAVWERDVPLDLFEPPAPTGSHPCDAVMQRSIEIVRKRVEAGTLYDERKKVSEESMQELGGAGYWGLLISPEFGGTGAPFARFAPFLTKMATAEATVAGLASVHGCIGAVDPVRTFGTPEQKKRLLPPLASGEKLSAFALTEPCAGSDLTALRTTATLNGDHYEVTGEKLFITNAIPGRRIGLVVLIDGKPAVLIADLPPQENEQFQMKRYGLWALKHTNNNGLLFNKFRVPKENLLKPPIGDGLTIAYHGLNLGRLSLCANAAGTMRFMLASMLPWAHFRKTFGQSIDTRELVKRRIARLAGLIVATDALVAWGSWLIDEGHRGELEGCICKIFGSESQKEAAIELYMKTHGGRAFLHGHQFGDAVHEFLAPCIYEGEGEVLGLAFFKSLVKEHGKEFFEPIGKALKDKGMKTFNPMNPLHAFKLRKEAMAYGKWLMGRKLSGGGRATVPAMDSRLSAHVDFALSQFKRSPLELDGVMRKHQMKLPDRQCRMADVSARVQDTVVLLVTALSARGKSEATIAAADFLCHDLRRKLTGERPSDSYFRSASKLADAVIDGGFDQIAGVPREQILMPYSQ
jgi:alkylation response protein AidB-like acyl-CoA dehydrogenase